MVIILYTQLFGFQIVWSLKLCTTYLHHAIFTTSYVGDHGAHGSGGAAAWPEAYPAQEGTVRTILCCAVLHHDVELINFTVNAITL